MGKTKALTTKQKQRAELNAALSFTEGQLVRMQGQNWKDLNDDQINILENFLATAIATMRICPPAHVSVASNTVMIRAKANEALLQNGSTPLGIDYGTDGDGNVYYGTGTTPDTLQKAVNQGKLKERNGILREHNVKS